MSKAHWPILVLALVIFFAICWNATGMNCAAIVKTLDSSYDPGAVDDAFNACHANAMMLPIFTAIGLMIGWTAIRYFHISSKKSRKR